MTVIKFKKIFIVILMLSVFLSGCQRQAITGMSENENNVSTSENSPAPETTPMPDAGASADQPTGKNIKSDNNQSKSPSEELELTWQDKAKKYVGDARQFLYKIVYSLRYENVLLEINQLQQQEALQLYQLEEHQQEQLVQCHRQQKQQLAELAEQLRLQANRFFNFKLL